MKFKDFKKFVDDMSDVEIYDITNFRLGRPENMDITDVQDYEVYNIFAIDECTIGVTLDFNFREIMTEIDEMIVSSDKSPEEFVEDLVNSNITRGEFVYYVYNWTDYIDKAIKILIAYNLKAERDLVVV